MNPSRVMSRWSLAAVVLVPLVGCGATRNPNGMYRNVGVGRAAPSGESAAASAPTDIRTPQQILQGDEPSVHPQALPGFAREAVPDRVMLQDQVNAGYMDSPSPVD